MRQRLQFVADYNSAESVFTKEWQPTVDSLADYFRSHGSANERMTAYYLKGRVHHDLGEAPQALDAYQRATEQADTTRDDCDLHTLTAIYGQMADLFDAQYLPDNEMKALQMAERIAWKDKDTLAALVAFDLRSRPYYLKNELDSVMVVEKQARELYLKYGYKEKAAQAIYSTISILIDRQQNQEAGKYLDLYEKESGNFDENGDLIFGGHYYYNKGRYLLSVGQMDSARFYFQKALTRGQKEAGYKGLLSVYEKKNIPDSIAKYAKLFAAANDSSFLHVNQEKVHQISAMYDYSHYQRVAEKSKAKASRFMLYSLLLLFTIVAGALFFAYIYNRKRMKSRLQLSQLLNAKNKLQALLDETQGKIDAIQEVHHQALALHLDEKRALQTELDKLNVSLRRTSISKLKDAFSETEISKRFKEIKDRRPLLKPPSTLDWNMFQKTFKEYFPNYMAFIEQDHTLTKEHLRICMLLPMDFKEGDMAFFLEVNGQRIDRLKSQINYKFFNDSKSSSLRRHLKAQFYGGVDSV